MREQRARPLQIFRRIDCLAFFFCYGSPYAVAVFDPSQLFKRLGFFE